MAVLLPGLLVQDVWRSIFIARQRPRSAAADDALWTVLQFGALALLIVGGARNPAVLLAAWGLTGWVAAAVAVLWGKTRPSVRQGLRYARSTHDMSRYLVAEWLTVLGAAQLALLVISAIGSPADVGSLRAAQTLLGPLTILVVATFGFVVPELARRLTISDTGRCWVAVGVSATLTVLTLACGVVLSALPEHVGSVLLGEVWPGARACLPAMTLWMVGAALAAGPIAVIRSRGQARASFRVNVLIGLLLLVCVPAGFLMAGAAGAAAGFAVANVTPVPLFWVQMRKVLRERRAVDAS
jgi:O-antigen/teichoic acid export membrane protein